MEDKVLEQVYQEGLEERLIAYIAEKNGISLEKAMSIYYGSKLSTKIHNGNEEGPIVGNIIKRAAQNMMEMIGDADTYDINFPKDATPEEKFTLIMAGLFLDYRYYETNANDDNKKTTNRIVY